MSAMTYPYQNRLRDGWREEGREEGRAEGRVRGEAAALLMILQGRGIPVTSKICERVMSCTDADEIEGWLLRAAHANTADEVFDPQNLR